MAIPLRRAVCLLICLSLGTSGCGQRPPVSQPAVPALTDAPPGPPWFEDATDTLGLDFVHDPGPTGTYFMPQSMGSGAAFIHDADGTLYLYLIQGGGPGSPSVNRLYQRNPNGRFVDVTDQSGLNITGTSTGVAVADVNNDGRPDVVVSQYGGLRLFLNEGAGHFREVTAEAGLENPNWGTSLAFFDYDRDGWLDLFVVNYLDYDPKINCKSPQGLPDFCGPSSFHGTASKLFRNLGACTNAAGQPSVRFKDVSLETDIGTLKGPGLGIVCADFDGDGWPDVFVSNDGKPNRLWMNRPGSDGGRHFVDEAASRNVALTGMGKAFAGMGVAIGDIRNEGLLDLFVTHLNTETNTLWKQGPPGLFRDQTVEAGLTATTLRGSTGFGTLLADFDLDGSLDLVVVNGRVYRGGKAQGTNMGFWETYAEHNQVLAGDGTGKFRDLSRANPALCGHWNVARGLAVADFDDDGAPDLLVTCIGDRARLFRNVAPNRGHWLKIRALDPRRQRDAYGAEVRVLAGDRRWLRLVNPAQSYLSSSSPIALFGLGPVAQIDTIRVKWPDDNAEEEEFPGGAVDRSIVLRRGEGKSVARDAGTHP